VGTSVAGGRRARRLARRRFGPALLAVVAVGLAVRVAAVLVIDPTVPEVGDASAYHHLANQLADGLGYIRPFDRIILDRIRPTAEYPPLLPGSLGVASWLGATTVTAQRLVLCLAGAAGVGVVGLLGRRLGGPTVGLVAAGLAAVYPMLFLSDASLTPETLFFLLVALAVLLAYRAADRPSPVSFGLLGLVCGVAALTRAEGVLLCALLALPLAAGARALPFGRRAALAGAAVLGTAVVVLPWTARNHARFDEVVPISNNIGTALDGANCGPTYQGDRIGFWLYTPGGECFEGFDQAALDRSDEAAVARHHRSAGLRYARQHAGRLPAVVAVRELRTWGLWDPVDQTALESLEGRPLGWQRAGTVMYWVLAVLAVAGLVVLVRRRRRVWPLVAGAVAVVVTTAVTYGNQRFRVAAEPALLVLAAVALVTAAGRLGARRTGGRVVTAAASGPSADPGVPATGGGNERRRWRRPDWRGTSRTTR
jgi:4-amino-4-deoxy-L-arabinose transferase-like glycosyltransferase